MTIRKDPRSRYYTYSFERGGQRFHGSSKETSERKAAAFERIEIAKAERLIELKRKANGAPLALGPAMARYWQEAGQHHLSQAPDLKRHLDLVCGFLGAKALLANIGNPEVTALVAWRRSHDRWDDPKHGKISNSTVNRSAIEPLRRIFVHARARWGMSFQNEPNWGDHFLPEPNEIVRELQPAENAALASAMDPEHEVLRQFALASGLRQSECLLRWREVDLIGKRISVTGKGGKKLTKPIDSAIEAILLSRLGHDEIFVFTYIVQQTRGNKVRGSRMPITVNGLKTHWRRRRAKAGVSDFTYHGHRHDYASKLLRETGNLKLVQLAIGHADISTTTKYAHLADDAVLNGMEAANRRRNALLAQAKGEAGE